MNKMHECKTCKSDKMQDCLIDRNGVFSCRACGKNLDDADVHPFILNKYKYKYNKTNGY